MKFRIKNWIITLIAVVICFGVYLTVKTMYASDNAPPVIVSPSESITVSIKDGEAVFLEGVTAHDPEDGDLTGNIMIEGISKFYEKGKSRVTYAVVDSDNCVTKLTRDVIYSDYTSPYFSLTGSLDFSLGTAFDVSDYIKAHDCIDGDISDKIEITLSDDLPDISDLGDSDVIFTVTNSKGETITLNLTVTVTQKTTLEKRYDPVIYLKQYLLYLNVGDSFTPQDILKNIRAVTVDGATLETGIVNQNIYFDTDSVDTSKAGVYTVNYEYTSDAGYMGNTKLIVVVR